MATKFWVGVLERFVVPGPPYLAGLRSAIKTGVIMAASALLLSLVDYLGGGVTRDIPILAPFGPALIALASVLKGIVKAWEVAVVSRVAADAPDIDGDSGG